MVGVGEGKSERKVVLIVGAAVTITPRKLEGVEGANQPAPKSQNDGGYPLFGGPAAVQAAHQDREVVAEDGAVVGLGQLLAAAQRGPPAAREPGHLGIPKPRGRSVNLNVVEQKPFLRFSPHQRRSALPL